MKKYFVFLVVGLIVCAFAFPTSAFADSPDPVLPGYTASVQNAALAPAFNPVATTPRAVLPNQPALNEFVAKVKNGQSDDIIGVYVPKLLALHVIQQPADNPAYVASSMGTVTQFGPAAQRGTIGLLAHNFFSGIYFSKLTPGEEVDVVYGDGTVRRYSIASARHFQALSPNDPFSAFVDLDNEGVQLSSTDLFNLVFTGGNKVVFQTCIYANGDPSWGRLFVTALPVP